MRREEVERSVEPGEQVLARGSMARELFVVRSGRFRLRGPGMPDHERTRGEIFGELSAILGAPSPYSAEALEPSVVLALPLALLNRLCTDCPEFSFRLIAHLARERADGAPVLAPTPPPLAVLAPPVLVEPLAPAVPEIALAIDDALALLVPTLWRRRVAGELPIVVPGTLREIAEDAGMPIRSAYQALHHLLDRGYLQLVDDQLSILEPEALESLPQAR